MFALSDMFMWLFVFLLLWQGMTLIQFFTFLYFKLKDPVFVTQKRVDVSEEIKSIVQPLESFLFSKGFEHKGVLSHDGGVYGAKHTYYQFFYYNEEEGIHAYIETQPYAGAVSSAVIYYNTFFESRKICITSNYIGFALPTTPRSVYFFDHSLDTNEEVYLSHLKDRDMEHEEIIYEALDMEGYHAYAEYIHHDHMESNVEYGVAKRVDDGYRFTFSWATWLFSKRFAREYKSAIRNIGEARAEGSSSEQRSSEAVGLKVQLDAHGEKRGEGNKKSLFFISLAAFILLFYALGIPIIDIGMLIVILFVHELGHYLAMKLFKYRDISILFMPFGAVTIGKKEHRTAFEEFVVSMAGPLPGMIIGAVILIALTQYDTSALNHSYLNSYAMMSIVINYINLLPIYPLDGGRIMQTLLLSRYPRGQFYFYLVSLGILIVSMILLRDYILFIFIVILALALKQNYKISKVLQKLFKKKKKSELTENDVVELLSSDEDYRDESLVEKANIAKHAVYVINTGKPSRLLLTLGMGMYLFLITPVIAMGYFGFVGSFSEYADLSTETKKEVKVFYKNINSFKYLTKGDKEEYTLEASQKIIDSYLGKAETNITIGGPLDKNSVTSDMLPCEMPRDLKRVYAWHNGIESLLPYNDLYSYDQLKKSYLLESIEYGDSNQSVSFTSYNEMDGLAYVCGKKGVYGYPAYDGHGGRVYYSVNHFLKVTAEAYKEGAYKFEHGELSIDRSKLHKIKYKYLSVADKERENEKIAYLKVKAETYSRDAHPYLKKIVISKMLASYSSQLLPYVALFLHDKEKSVSDLAEAAVNEMSARK